MGILEIALTYGAETLITAVAFLVVARLMQTEAKFWELLAVAAVCPIFALYLSELLGPTPLVATILGMFMVACTLISVFSGSGFWPESVMIFLGGKGAILLGYLGYISYTSGGA